MRESLEIAYLVTVLKSQKKIDLVILMIPTTDLYLPSSTLKIY